MAPALIGEVVFEHIRLRVDCLDGPPLVLLEAFRLPSHAWSIGRLPYGVLLTKPPKRDRVASLLSVLYRLTVTEA